MGVLPREDLTGGELMEVTSVEGLGEFEGGIQIYRLDIFTGMRYLFDDVVDKIPRTCHQNQARV